MKNLLLLLMVTLLIAAPGQGMASQHHDTKVHVYADDHGHVHDERGNDTNDQQDASADKFHQFMHDHSHPASIFSAMVLPQRINDLKESFGLLSEIVISRSLAPNPEPPSHT